MTRHFDAQIHRLKRMMVQLGTDVEKALDMAIQSVQQRDADLAQNVIDGDRDIDLMEIEIGEECLHTLALYQPVASDLRYIGSILTINKDLERIADLAVNIAEQAIELAHEPPLGEKWLDLESESQRVRNMVSRSIDALVHMDADLAATVVSDDDEVDAIHKSVSERGLDEIRDNPGDVRRMVEIMTISRQLERVADHAVNVAEDVIYVVRGEIVRHNQVRHSV